MSSASIIGIDLGGTKIKGVRYSSTAQISEEKQIETLATEGFDSVYERLIGLIRELQEKDTNNIGVGVPGLINSDGSIFKLPNIPRAETFPLQQRLTGDLGLQVAVANDANCFTLGEALHGAGKPHSVVVGITLGTGVGGGMAIDGKPFRGANGYGMEIGHMLLKPGEPPFDTKDKRGDIEQFISGSAIRKRFSDLTMPTDIFAKKEKSQILTEVAWMCVNITHLLDPSIIVFGGGVGLALASHLQAIIKEMQEWILPGTPLPELACAERKDAATLGAALFTQYGSDS